MSEYLTFHARSKRITLRGFGGGLLMLLICLLSACSNPPPKSGLTIACAASVQFAVNDLAAAFAKGTKQKVDVVTGSSGRLTTQIMNGAPYDIFFSANMDFPELLFQEGKTAQPPAIYGQGIPVFWTMQEDLDLGKMADLLTSSAVEKIAIADPLHAPFGAMAKQYLQDNGWYATIEPKLVFGESVSQVNEYILNRTVEIGLSSKSIVSSPKLKGKGKVLELEKEYWIDLGLVAIGNGQSDELKNQFLQFVKSDKGKGILKNYGIAF